MFHCTGEAPNADHELVAQQEQERSIRSISRLQGRGLHLPFFDTFYIFIQIFVANPKRPPEIEAILKRNKEKLLRFFDNFLSDRGDGQFNVRVHFMLLTSRCVVEAPVWY